MGFAEINLKSAMIASLVDGYLLSQPIVCKYGDRWRIEVTIGKTFRRRFGIQVNRGSGAESFDDQKPGNSDTILQNSEFGFPNPLPI